MWRHVLAAARGARTPRLRSGFFPAPRRARFFLRIRSFHSWTALFGRAYLFRTYARAPIRIFRYSRSPLCIGNVSCASHSDPSRETIRSINQIRMFFSPFNCFGRVDELVAALEIRLKVRTNSVRKRSYRDVVWNSHLRLNNRTQNGSRTIRTKHLYIKYSYHGVKKTSSDRNINNAHYTFSKIEFFLFHESQQSY